MGLAENTLRLYQPAGAIASATYRGPDRRRASSATLSSGPFSIGVPIFLLVSHVAVIAVAVKGSWSLDRTTGPGEWLTACIAVIAALAGAMYVMRWRLTGNASSIWVGAGLLIYSGANIAFPGLVQSFAAVDSGAGSVAGLLRPASVFVVMALLAMAALSPAIDARVRPAGVAVFAAGGALVAMVVASWSVDVRLLLGPALDRPVVGGLGAFGQVGIAVVWVALAAAFIFPMKWSGRQPMVWIGIMLLGLAEARLTLAMSVNGDARWMLASQLLRLFGVAAALGGAFHQLQLAFTVQTTNLLDSIVELESAREERRIVLATAEERAHDLRSALGGIGGAAVTLERYQARLSDEERASLTRAVSAEIARLQQIVGDVRPVPVPFGLKALIEPLAVCASDTARVCIDIDTEVIAFGRPGEVGEILQNLLVNARRHAPRSPITIRAKMSDGRVEVRVEDRGPGVRPEHHALIFERGWTGPSATGGTGLGLYNARRLAREQGGDLRVESRLGGGVTFVLALPVAVNEEGG